MVMPYLNFSGNCEEAFKLYERAFDGKIGHFVRYGDSPYDPENPMDEMKKNQVMHAQMMLSDLGGISGADAGFPYEKGSAVNIHVHFTLEEKAEKAFAVLAEEGVVIGNLAQNPPPDDAGKSGVVKDKFGFIWVLSV